jgi:N-acylneuraminate cytidylyltransferase
MKAIIPVKSSSSRVENKNWRPFFGEFSLTEIKIRQLLPFLDKKDIYMSCENIAKKSLADAYGIQFLLRDPLLCQDQTSWADVVTQIVEATPFDEQEEVLWVEVVNPLFSNFGDMLQVWKENKHRHDSLLAVSTMKKYLLDSSGKPVNFQFGRWHTISQQLPTYYAWDSMNIMKKRDILYYHYPIGNTPYLYAIDGQTIDIDTLQEFELAQKLFAQVYERI